MLELLACVRHLRRRPPHELVADLEDMLGYVLMFPVTSQERHRDSAFLHLEIDLRHPADVLIDMVEDELREAIGDDGRQRRRLDKVDFYLGVYDDIAIRGEPFATVARRRNQRVSTVRSAYAAALRNIFGPGAVPSRAELAQSGIDWATFDFEKHSRTCPRCKIAPGPDEFCPPVRAYVNQDFKGQQEQTGHDTVRG
jgi:hypothetical protein